MQKLIRGVLVLALAAGGGAVLASPAEAAVTIKTFKNCTELNKKYKHGVGKKGAKDKVRGKTKAVTTFYVNTKLYNANKKSDRDKDGVACEKR
ncbi:excalibur calcium-binding domain-containing protein [Actinoplanes palleronii]|uniref:excalibur calcium-binding domain-containing protein n=1 Tax=Actinoplanes palleronii TaxID=113570 RepID=UPI00194515B7|nr:excalibur calcium-binding domain-containing protein [Actinoplanes palleronii]